MVTYHVVVSGLKELRIDLSCEEASSFYPSFCIVQRELPDASID